MSSPGCWRTEQELRGTTNLPYATQNVSRLSQGGMVKGIDQQTKSDWYKSTGSKDAGPYSCTTTSISSGSNSNTKTLIEYDIDETLDIKEEIIPDQEGHQWEKHNLRSERNQLDEKCIITENSSDNNSRVKTTIEYDIDETLEIKEESVQDHGNMDQRLDKTYKSKLHTLDTREADIMTVKEPRTSKKKKLQEAKSEPKKKYHCEKCSRSFTQTGSLNRHKRFECGVQPLFSCEFCDRRFKQKGNMKKHITLVHQKTKSKISQTTHNCDKCSRSYIWPGDLSRHKLLEHAAVRPQFTCYLCGYQTMRKDNLSEHITSLHFQKIHSSAREKKYKCEKCGRSYFRENSFNHHKKFQCDVLPQFSCESCGKSFKSKSNMNAHIVRVHQKTNSKASQTRHNCDQCPRNYSFAGGLHMHKRLEHAALRPRFFCDFCGFQSKQKSDLSKHINARHIKKNHVSTTEKKKKYKCEKCARLYAQKKHLTAHKKFECGVMPQFSCKFCGEKFKRKSTMNRHILGVHQKTK